MVYEKIVEKLHVSISQVLSISKMWISNSTSALFIDVNFYQTGKTFKHYFLDIKKIFNIILHTRKINYLFIVMKVHGENS